MNCINKEILISKSKNNKILIWSGNIKQIGMQTSIFISYGQLLGAKTIRIKNITGKNIGKENQTTATEQAKLELKSLVNSKLDSGYIYITNKIQNTNITDDEFLKLCNNLIGNSITDATGFIKPMKALQYFKSKKEFIDSKGIFYKDKKYYFLKNYNNSSDLDTNVKFPCIAQSKINGVRCLSTIINGKVILKSKEGKFFNLPLIERQVEQLLQNSNIILDGELYIHNEPLQTIISAIKSINLNTSRIVYKIFDIANSTIPFVTRYKNLKILFENTKNIILSNVEIVKSYSIHNNKSAQQITDLFISKGYEGSIFRSFNNRYESGKRSSTMHKLKRIISNEFTIIDIISQKENILLGLFVCINKNGKIFEVNPSGTEEYKKNLLCDVNNIKGKKLTCEFYEYTIDYIPFHIVNSIIRDYE